MHLNTYTDGGSRGNPGPMAIGGVVVDDDGKVLKEVSEYLGVGTNNQAEYTALYRTIEEALKFKPKEVDCYMDSELAMKQMNGIYRIKDAYLQKMAAKIRDLTKNTPVRYHHVRREKNKHADRLVNLALDHHLYSPS